MARFLVGVNYWPRSSGAAMWTQFDLTEIDVDFARIAALGFDLVRVFLTWEAFAPAPDTLAVEPLDDFVALLDTAHAHGLRAIATLSFGHDGAVNRLPAWALDRTRRATVPTLVGNAPSPWGAGDLYAGDLLEAQRGFARAIGERAREHAALLAWDIGNAVTAVREPASSAHFEHWNAALAHDLLLASNVGATTSLRSNDIVGRDAVDDLAALAEPWKFPSLDARSGTLAFARTRSDGEIDRTTFLIAAFAMRARRAPMITSFDVSGGESTATTLASVRDSLERIHRAGALGLVWWRWCEDAAGSAPAVPLDETPVARVLADFARERRAVVEPEPPDFDERRLREEVAEAYVAYRDAQHFNEEIS